MQQAQQIQGDSVQEVCRVKASSGKAQVRHNAQGENRGGEEIRCGTLQSDVTLMWAQGGEGSSYGELRIEEVHLTFPVKRSVDYKWLKSVLIFKMMIYFSSPEFSVDDLNLISDLLERVAARIYQQFTK